MYIKHTLDQSNSFSEKSFLLFVFLFLFGFSVHVNFSFIPISLNVYIGVWAFKNHFWMYTPLFGDQKLRAYLVPIIYYLHLNFYYDNIWTQDSSNFEGTPHMDRGCYPCHFHKLSFNTVNIGELGSCCMLRLSYTQLHYCLLYIFLENKFLNQASHILYLPPQNDQLLLIGRFHFMILSIQQHKKEDKVVWCWTH